MIPIAAETFPPAASRWAGVSRLVLRHALALTGVGVAIGSLPAAVLAQFMAALLFGVGAVDPLTYAAVAAGLAVIALLASSLPFRTAVSVDPIAALRWE